MEVKRDSVVALYLVGKPQVAIVRALQCINVNTSFVSPRKWTKKTATSAEMARKVKKRPYRNPRRSGRKMARELNMPQYAIRQILKNELGVVMEDPKRARSYRSSKKS